MLLVLLTRRGNLEKKCFGKGCVKCLLLFLRGGNAVNYGFEINLEDWLLCRASVSWEACSVCCKLILFICRILPD